MSKIENPTLTWMESVKSAVNSLQTDYHVNRGMLLTEGDLECHLYNKLLQQKNLSGYHRCKNDSVFNTKGSSELRTGFIHSQVTWFKEGQKSGFEVDLTISDPKKLEVKNIELFEEYTSKGFAYDGPCIAIELKFIRQLGRANTLGQEDYLKLRDKLIPAKIHNIEAGMYKESRITNIAFVSIVGCKDKDIFDTAKFYLGKHLSVQNPSCPENLFTYIFYQDEIIWDKDELRNYFKNHEALI